MTVSTISTVSTPSTLSLTGTFAAAGKGSNVAPELYRKLAGDEPLLEVVNWYITTYFDPPGPALDELILLYGMDATAEEFAAMNLCREGYQSEAEIDTRPCKCVRRDADMCRCYATLKVTRASLKPGPDHVEAEVVKIFAAKERTLANRAREVMHAHGDDKVIPQKIDLWHAVLFLAPLGDELAREMLGQGLRHRPDHCTEVAPLAEILFHDRRYAELLFAALDAHPDYNWGTVLRWWFADTAIAESARLIKWFCATHPTRLLQIERDLKIRMRKQGWRV
jgi:hypothetical protein